MDAESKEILKLSWDITARIKLAIELEEKGTLMRSQVQWKKVYDMAHKLASKVEGENNG